MKIFQDVAVLLRQDLEERSSSLLQCHRLYSILFNAPYLNPSVNTSVSSAHYLWKEWTIWTKGPKENLNPPPQGTLVAGGGGGGVWVALCVRSSMSKPFRWYLTWRLGIFLNCPLHNGEQKMEMAKWHACVIPCVYSSAWTYAYVCIHTHQSIPFVYNA